MSIGKLLRFEEGERLKPYKCTAGKLTIGIGRNLEDKGITKQEALFLLSNDIKECTSDIAKALPWSADLDDARRDVLIAMRFQMGLNGLLGFHNFLRNMRDGDWLGAAQSLQDSKLYKQTPSRTERMMFIVLNGSYPEVYK